jgi:hypothetical protein
LVEGGGSDGCTPLATEAGSPQCFTLVASTGLVRAQSVDGKHAYQRLLASISLAQTVAVESRKPACSVPFAFIGRVVGGPVVVVFCLIVILSRRQDREVKLEVVCRW